MLSPRACWRQIDPASIRANGYSYLIEMLYNVQRAGFTVGETPIIFADRRLGQSKISRNEIYRAMRTVARLEPAPPERKAHAMRNQGSSASLIELALIIVLIAIVIMAILLIMGDDLRLWIVNTVQGLFAGRR